MVSNALRRILTFHCFFARVVAPPFAVRDLTAAKIESGNDDIKQNPEVPSNGEPIARVRNVRHVVDSSNNAARDLETVTVMDEGPSVPVMRSNCRDPKRHVLDIICDGLRQVPALFAGDAQEDALVRHELGALPR